MEPQSNSLTLKNPLLLLNSFLLFLGNCGGPILMRLYFLHGGKRVWFTSWLETAAWPLMFIPIAFSYLQRRRPGSKPELFLITPRLFMASAFIGVLTGIVNYLYSYGVARLPVSTSSLIIASQLAFTAAFAFVLVKQKFTSYSVNSVFLLTIGAGILAMHTNGDRPDNESSKQYVMGFLMTVGASLLYGFVLPLIELMYKKAKKELSYSLIIEIQTVMCLFSTAFCTVGMLFNKDFQAIRGEAREFGLGESMYYVVAITSAIVWQCFFVGAAGVIFCASSLLSGIIIAVGLPIIEVLAVIFYQESFKAEKGVSLALSLWGFVSYFYGEIKLSRKKKSVSSESEMSGVQKPNSSESESFPVPNDNVESV